MNGPFDFRDALRQRAISGHVSHGRFHLTTDRSSGAAASTSSMHSVSAIAGHRSGHRAVLVFVDATAVLIGDIVGRWTRIGPRPGGRGPILPGAGRRHRGAPFMVSDAP